MVGGSNGHGGMSVPCAACTLRAKSLFRPFSQIELDFVQSMKSSHRVLPAKAEILRQGETGGPIYTLFEGWAARYVKLPDGSRQIFDILLPGDMIGLGAAALGTTSHSVQAVTPVSLCVLEGRGLDGLFTDHPALALAVLQTRVEEEQRADLRLALLGRRSPVQRIGYFLLELHDRLRRRGMVNGGTTFPFPLRRIDIADIAGLSKMHVARTLQELRTRQLAEIDGGSVILGDAVRLAEISGYVASTAVGRRAIL
jgi:CRP-like cAMP-binding protein